MLTLWKWNTHKVGVSSAVLITYLDTQLQPLTIQSSLAQQSGLNLKFGISYISSRSLELRSGVDLRFMAFDLCVWNDIKGVAVKLLPRDPPYHARSSRVPICFEKAVKVIYFFHSEEDANFWNYVKCRWESLGISHLIIYQLSRVKMILLRAGWFKKKKRMGLEMYKDNLF